MIEKKKKIKGLIQEKAMLRKRTEKMLLCMRALKLLKFIFFASLIFLIAYVERVTSTFFGMGILFSGFVLLERYIHHVHNSRKRHISKINRQIYNLWKIQD